MKTNRSQDKEPADIVLPKCVCKKLAAYQFPIDDAVYANISRHSTHLHVSTSSVPECTHAVYVTKPQRPITETNLCVERHPHVNTWWLRAHAIFVKESTMTQHGDQTCVVDQIHM